MLVLSRKVGERILVPECGVTVTVLAVKGGQVRLGVAAPADVEIVRAELREPDRRLPARVRVPVADRRKDVA
jgi:carbon storage regulator